MYCTENPENLFLFGQVTKLGDFEFHGHPIHVLRG